MPDGSQYSAMGTSPPSHNLLDRLPPHILGGLSVEQRSAIATAAGQRNAKTHKVNIRVSLPFLPKQWYFTVLAGPERRAVERRRTERARNPVRTVGNMAFIFLAALTFYGFGVAALMISSSVLDY